MQPKLFEILGLAETKGDVGLEIECEGERLVEVKDAFWRSEPDGSLRGHYPEASCEYILKKPVPSDKVEACLKQLNKHLEESKLNFSFRTSVHVHVNVQQLNVDQVMNMIYTYLLIEEPLVTFCGKVRKGNQFALRLSDAEGLLEGLSEIFTTGQFYWGVDQYRYAGLNIEALTKYGSLEFRSMRGTLDVETLTTWTHTLINLREYACSKENPIAVYEEFVALGAREFFNKVVGKYAGSYNYPRLTQEIQRNFSLTIDLPHMFKRQLEARNKPKPKKAEVKAAYEIGDIIHYDVAIKLVTDEKWPANYFQAMGNQEYKIIKLKEKRKLLFQFEPLPVEVWDEP